MSDDEPMDVTVEQLRLPTPHMSSVIGLHKRNSKTLGFFPAGAFDEHARMGRILVAIEGDKLLGYVLYRVARGRATIVHLCIADDARGRGVVGRLLERLKRDTRNLEGIGLHCRRDYDANHMWAKFGFEALINKTGRGKDGAELTYWWFSHGHPDLFSHASAPDPARQRVAIDANVFFDLHTREGRGTEDSKALLADWVQASIEIVVTKELRNEIEKSDNREQRKANRAAAAQYVTLPADDASFQLLCDEIRPLLPESVSLRDEADLRQVAYAIAGGASFLVTRDHTMIERCEPLYLSHGLMVLHPSELINHLDSIEREEDYRPARVEGSKLTNTLLKAEAIESVVEAFKQPCERAADLSKILLGELAHPKTSDVQVVSDAAGAHVLLGVMGRQDAKRMAVPVLRRSSHPLGATMTRNFLRSCLSNAAEEGRDVVSVEEQGFWPAAADILQEFGFVHVGKTWVKLTLRDVGDLDRVNKAISNMVVDPCFDDAKRIVIEGISALDGGLRDPLVAAAAIERHLWPAKVIGGGVPTFIVAIRPGWAQHFFDVELGSQVLFGLREDLHLGVEGVYYRSAENNNLVAPGRILWYVSKGEGDGSMAIKACSQLEEVLVGKPKDLFRRFRRLGVYEWRDVFVAAKGDIKKDVVAFRFRMTERFKNPVGLAMLAALAIRGPFMSPRRISDDQFAAIYRGGCGLA